MEATNESLSPSSARIGAARTTFDVCLILLLVAAMVAVRATAPSNTYSYAQFWQIRASVDHLHGGSWLRPKIDSTGAAARKPPLYAWGLTATFLAADAESLGPAAKDFLFRVPTILAAAGLAVLVYFLGRRWFSRPAGLIAAGLWLTCLQLGKLIYLATTDMLLAWWVGLCIFAVDRLTFHPARRRRWAWGVLFWAAMALAAITKGWGVVNLAILGAFVLLAAAVGPGFRALRDAWGWLGVGTIVMGLAVVAAMLAIFVPIWLGWESAGGGGFRATAYREVWQRLTGQGAHAPGAGQDTHLPALAHLYYNTLPVSIFAGCALFLVPLRQWRRRQSPIALPVAWVAVVVLAFSIPHGFRPDYLLPCYPAVALLGAWAVGELQRRWRAGWHGHAVVAWPCSEAENAATNTVAAVSREGGAKHLRRICQAVPFVLAAGLLVIPPLYFFHDSLPWGLNKKIPLPPEMAPGTWMILAILPAVGLAAVAAGLFAVRRRSLDLAVAATCACMLGVLFCNGRLWSRHARTGDGDAMVLFATLAQPFVGDEPFIAYWSSKVGPEVYLLRFGESVSTKTTTPRDEQANLNASSTRWLFVTDRGLLRLGAYALDPAGPGMIKSPDGGKIFYQPRPADLGRVAARSVRPIQHEYWGTIYLIEVQRPIRPTSPPLSINYLSDPVR